MVSMSLWPMSFWTVTMSQPLEESRGIRVAEFVQRCARDFGGFGVGVVLMSRLQHQAFFVEIFCHGSKLIHLAA